MTDLLRPLAIEVRGDTATDVRAEWSLRARLGIKRAADIVIAAVGLLLTLPALLVLGALIRLDSPGPALFRQTRVGAAGRRFRIMKFRTMVVDAEHILASDSDLHSLYKSNEFKLSIEDDPRITRLGAFLRRMSLDELPQLWNVLRGEMSLVGARPVPEDHYQAFGPAKSAYAAFRPGITGFWQVNGRNLASMPDSNRYYAENWSLWLDLRLLLKTIPAVLTRHGAH